MRIVGARLISALLLSGCATRASTRAVASDDRRIVALGDLHGDLAPLKRALRLTGLTDSHGTWTGSNSILVQVGDQLDRGPDEREILETLEDLKQQAERAGGEVHVLIGNHETMNVELDFDYVTPGGFEDFRAVTEGPSFENLPPEARGRARAFQPGGPWAVKLASHPVVLQLGDTVFVHGGLTERWAKVGISKINRDVSSWMTGARSQAPEVIHAEDGPLWHRGYAQPPIACDELERALSVTGARRMVIAHTPQLAGITSGCGKRVWRIDTGMSAHYGGPTEALEIIGDRVRVVSPAEH